MKPNNIVENIKNHIEQHDRLVELFGMDIQEVEAGRAVVSMQVDERHLNAAGFCHGAVIFALADVAFALASNARGRVALALEASVNYFRPVSPGSVLSAVAEEKYRGRRTAYYQVVIEDSNARLVSEFKATAFCVDDSPLNPA